MHVIGFKPPDDKWKKMKAVWDTCLRAGVAAPEEVGQFFNWTAPDEQGVEVAQKELPVRELAGESGFELDVTKLDKDIKIVRFFCSW